MTDPSLTIVNSREKNDLGRIRMSKKWVWFGQVRENLAKKRKKVYLCTENADLIIFETEKMDLRSRL